jgi:hypothetical protein
VTLHHKKEPSCPTAILDPVALLETSTPHLGETLPVEINPTESQTEFQTTLH